MTAGDFVFDVVSKLQAIDKPVTVLAGEIGVDYNWLKMFRRGEIPNPAARPFRRVEAYVVLHAPSGNIDVRAA